MANMKTGLAFIFVGICLLSSLSGCLSYDISQVAGRSLVAGSRSSTLTSPRYPYTYGNRMDYSVTISARAGQVVKITIVDMDIENHSTCRYDYLELGDSSTRLCGRNKEGYEWTSAGNVVTVSFHTDSSTTKKGFELNYVAAAEDSEVQSSEECAFGFTRVGSNCYMLPRMVQRTQEDSGQICSRYGARLAIFHDTEEFESVTDWMKATRWPSAVWIGLHSDRAGNWYWDDGSRLSQDSPLWGITWSGRKQPDGGQENAGVIGPRDGPGILIHDQVDTWRRQALCQIIG